ncbi:MAG: WD40/YVTN/BNR-like repeat-containing protein [Oscillochloridaceae bacterium umkhey_bin13]
MAKAGLVYVGTDDGLVTLSDPGGTGRWRNAGTSLPGQRIKALLAADALTLVVATEGRTLRSSDGGQHWLVAPEADAASVDEFMSASGLPVSTAQGPGRWRGTVAPAPGATQLAILAGKQETMIAAIAGGTTLVRSEDSGTTWQQVSAEVKGVILVLTPSSYHMDIIWAGTDQGQLLRSDDRGRTWAEVMSLPQPVRCLAVMRIIS